jgi:hypothetical protein
VAAARPGPGDGAVAAWARGDGVVRERGARAPEGTQLEDLPGERGARGPGVGA